MKGRINLQYELTLRTAFERRPFTTRQAVDLYLAHHADRSHGCTDDAWREMSARNNLTMLTQRGLLTRISRGVYTFRKDI